MDVLVINCGSSSLKYQLVNMDTEDALASGICERIGIDGRFTFKSDKGQKYTVEAPMKDHNDAIRMVLEALVNKETGVIDDLSHISAVGHRVVHGGEKFSDSVVITDEVMDAISECNELAPLHNPANLIGISACAKALPGIPQVAVFDTAFHQTMPAKAYTYALPHNYYTDYHVRRYGFHGTSHKFVSNRLIELAGLNKDDSKVVICHLGGGASVTAVQNGKSVDTSMGMTPLEGVPMGTRSGSIDPAIIDFICKKENKTVAEVMSVLNKESGVLGMSDGLSSDFRDIWDAADSGNNNARVALDVFCYQVAKTIGSYITAMNGVDAIAFTAGIGENDHGVREEVLSYFGYLGIEIDKEANNMRGKEQLISKEGRIKVYVIPTNEELAIARATVSLVK